MYVSVAGDPLDPVVVVTVCGELGMDSASELSAALNEMIDRATTRVVIDLSAMAYCDFIGLSAFVDTHRRCTRAGGYLRLAAPSPMVRYVLSVVDMLAAIPVYDSVAAATLIDNVAPAAPNSRRTRAHAGRSGIAAQR
ncbi:MAG TPA: STAS domain-containing protein [Micromonosporaceae bacterium]|nr:STAS domain-containing protein [Micromonosporaceae bacterium]